MKTKKLFSQIILILFLVMIALGFTIPVLDFNNQNVDVEPRICQKDTDCYLVCDDLPVKVLCLQNLCQQNSCNGENLYVFENDPLEFQLSFSGFPTEFSTLDDIFIKYDQKKVDFYSSKLSLGNFFERVGFTENNYRLIVNGEDSYFGDNYLPQEKDVIEIIKLD